jgi:hypothetical protein
MVTSCYLPGDSRLFGGIIGAGIASNAPQPIKLYLVYCYFQCIMDDRFKSLEIEEENLLKQHTFSGDF